jgi:hypothetical protein
VTGSTAGPSRRSSSLTTSGARSEQYMQTPSASC